MATAWRWPPGEGADGLFERGDVDVEPVEDLLGLLPHGLIVKDLEDAEAPPHALAPEENVGADIEVLGEGEVLVDRLDPRGEGVHRRLDAGALPPYEDLALVGLVHARDDLDEGRLARAVVAEEGEGLPALSPMLTRSTAVRPPKRFVIFLVSSR